jgi:hypothetical protein
MIEQVVKTQVFVLLSFPARKSGEGILFNPLSNGSKSGVAKSGSGLKQGFHGMIPRCGVR